MTHERSPDHGMAGGGPSDDDGAVDAVGERAEPERGTQPDGAPSSGRDGLREHEPTGWRRWLEPGTLGTLVLIGVMVAAGVLAAITVTPRPDGDALLRPEGGDVVVAGSAPLSWDPAAISDAASAQLLSQVYEGLTVLDGGSTVRPALAESWRTEDDGRRLVFTLREGLTFSDGSPLDAADVRRSWLRVLDPAAPSPLASLLDDVVGAAAYARGQGAAERVGIRADGRTLTVDLVRPAAYFPAVAAAPTLAVVPEAIDDLARGPRPGTTFAASGAYVATGGEPGQLWLEANEAYWAGGPPTKRITIVTDLGGRSEVDVFEDEAVDWIRVSPIDASWIRYDEMLGPQLRRADELVVDLLGFDTTRPPFDDPAARRAVAMAVDWRRLAALDAPEALPPTSIVPPGAEGREEEDALPPYDPDGARAELAAAGYPAGEGFPNVPLVTYGAGPAEAIAHEVERELGIGVDVEYRSFADHSALLDSDTPAMWTLSWSADYPHAHDFLGLLLRSDSSANPGGWSNAAFDELIDAAAATDDATEQQQHYAEAQAILREEVPLIPLGYGGSWSLSREGLRGAGVSGVGLLRFADLVWAG